MNKLEKVEVLSHSDEMREFDKDDGYPEGQQFIGITAKATIKIQLNDNTSIIHTVETPGLWGIEEEALRDCSEFIAETVEEELATLGDMLLKLNISTSIKEVRAKAVLKLDRQLLVKAF